MTASALVVALVLAVPLLPVGSLDSSRDAPREHVTVPAAATGEPSETPPDIDGQEAPRPPARPAQPAQPAEPAQPAPARAARPRSSDAPEQTPVIAPRAPRRPSLPVNVQVDIIVTEQTPATPPIVRRAQLMTADGESTSVRNHSVWRGEDGRGAGDAPFRIDLQADVLDDARVRLRIGVDYGLQRPGDMVNSGQVTVRQAVIVRNGQSIVIAETADPVTDRTVKIEAKATIVK